MKTNWICIKDKMPVEGKDVIVYVPMYEKFIVANHWKGAWSDTIPKIGNYYIKVSHWMELPSKPTN